MRSGRWEPKEGVELEGKTLALIGSGAIAMAVARIAAAGFGMRVIGYARSARQTPSPHFAAITTDFAEAVGEADFVSLHIPGSPENARFINAERLALMPPRAWLVNTARGAVVDELALYRRARRRPPGGCGARRVRARAVPARRSGSRSAHARERHRACRTSAATPWKPTGAWRSARSGTCAWRSTETCRAWISSTPTSCRAEGVSRCPGFRSTTRWGMPG